MYKKYCPIFAHIFLLIPHTGTSIAVASQPFPLHNLWISSSPSSDARWPIFKLHSLKKTAATAQNLEYKC
jgi:hypothetical protein